MNFVPFFFLLIAAANSASITCRFEIVSSYRCFVTDLTIDSKEHQFVNYAVGEHLEGSSNEDVKAVAIDGIKIEFFPKNLEKIFPNLESIGISSTGLKEITSEDLKPFGERLEYLWLWNQEIKELKSDTFAYNPNLKVLVLQYNKIKKVEAGALSSLKNLETLNFGDNLCADDTAYNREGVENLVAVIEEKCEDKSENFLE